MENKDKICGECKFFTDEDAFGDGRCNKHDKECFSENMACDGMEYNTTGLIFARAWIAGSEYQREVTRRHAVEVCKQMCPSKNSRGCANLLHKRETKVTHCDGNCARVKYFISGMDKQEFLSK